MGEAPKTIQTVISTVISTVTVARCIVLESAAAAAVAATIAAAVAAIAVAIVAIVVVATTVGVARGGHGGSSERSGEGSFFFGEQTNLLPIDSLPVPEEVGGSNESERGDVYMYTYFELEPELNRELKKAEGGRRNEE